MYVQPYSTRFKHKINFKTPTSNKYIGDVTSFSDSSLYRVSSSLIIQEARIADFPSIAQGQYSSFLLAAPHDSKSEITKYLTFLRANPHKAALVYFDSAGSSGLLVPIRENEFHLIGGSDGFRCCIIQLKQKEAKPAVPATAPVSALPAVVADRGSEQLAAASHYNDLKRERATRHQSHIFHMRNLNNVIKTEIISSAGMKAKLDSINYEGKMLNGVSVIDFGCGMGGDIFKWFKNPAGLSRYVGVDIANNSLKQFTERLISHNFTDPRGYPLQGEHRKVTHLVCADIGTESLTDSVLDCHTWREGGNGKEGGWDRRVPLTDRDQFDVASCQFAMHYMFQSSAKAHHFFEQVSRHLKPGGVFIATTMDCRVIAEALSELLYGCFDPAAQHLNPNKHLEYAGIVTKVAADTSSNSAQDGSVDLFASIKALAAQRTQGNTAQKELSYVNDVGSEILRMKFSEQMWPRLLRLNNNNTTTHNKSSTTVDGSADESAYGIQYTFTLHDSDADAAVDAPEWVVPLGDTLRALAAAHGLRLLEVQNFQDIMTEMMQSDAKMRKLESMHVFNYKGTLSDAEWRIARLYLKLVFVKDREPGQHAEPASPDHPPPGYFAPTSPDHPPPGYHHEPSSPDHPPPGYGASTPDFPPPGYGASTPDFPPPGHRQPSSPDFPPPGYIPSSPDFPPPGHHMPSPDHPPPGYFAPSSPDFPPPGHAAPSSPDFPPPGYHAPASPDYPPPGYNAGVNLSKPSIGKRARNPYDSDPEESSPAPRPLLHQQQQRPATAKKARTAAAPSYNPYGSDSESDTEVTKPSKPTAATPAETDPFKNNPFASKIGASADPFGANPFSLSSFDPNKNPFEFNPVASSNTSAAVKSTIKQGNKYGSDSEDERPTAPRSAPAAVTAASGPVFTSYESDSDGEGSTHSSASGDGDGVMDEQTRKLMELRNRAIELAGGYDVWDELDDDQIEEYMEQAREDASKYD